MSECFITYNPIFLKFYISCQKKENNGNMAMTHLKRKVIGKT